MIKQYLDLIIVSFVVLSIVLYDTTIDIFLNVLHFFFELLHWGYEWFELGIEHTVEHLFHTSRHGSQIVTFYILLLIVCLALYALWRVLPRLYKRFLQFMHQSWLRRKTELEAYWLSLTLANKVKVLSTAMGVMYLSSFWVM